MLLNLGRDFDDLTFDLRLQASVARCASPSQASKSHLGEMNPSHACHTCKLAPSIPIGPCSFAVLQGERVFINYSLYI